MNGIGGLSLRNEHSDLTMCDIRGQKLKYIPVWVRCIRRMYRLDASHNELSAMPSDCSFTDTLEILDLSHNAFVDVPREILFMSNLHTLDISGNAIGRIPAWINQMVTLQDLRLPTIKSKDLCHIWNATDCRSVIGVVRMIGVGKDGDSKPPLTMPKLKHLVFTLERYPNGGDGDGDDDVCVRKVFTYTSALEIARAIQQEVYNRMDTVRGGDPFFTLSLHAPPSRDPPPRPLSRPYRWWWCKGTLSNTGEK